VEAGNVPDGKREAWFAEAELGGAAWEKKWAIMESDSKLRQNEYELNQWNADLIVMSQDLEKLTPPLRAMYEQKQMEIMKRRGINTPPTSES
jgi:hypothetical protein